MNKTLKTCLYFLAGGALTEAASADAEAIERAHRVNVKFRNGSISNSGAPEFAEFVAGEPIPFEYMAYARLTASGTENAAQTPAPAANINPGTQTDASQKPVSSDLASEIGSAPSGNTTISGGWGTSNT